MNLQVDQVGKDPKQEGQLLLIATEASIITNIILRVPGYTCGIRFHQNSTLCIKAPALLLIARVHSTCCRHLDVG